MSHSYRIYIPGSRNSGCAAATGTNRPESPRHLRFDVVLADDSAPIPGTYATPLDRARAVTSPPRLTILLRSSLLLG